MTGSPDGLVPLAGSWTLIALDGGPVPAVGRTPTIAFREDGAVSGTGGVNRIMTRLAKDDVAQGRIAFAPAATTRMAGPPEAMELERVFLDHLDAISTFIVEGGTLRLFAGDHEALRFERAE